MTSAPRPGWYPDPAGATDAFRWWDGQSWTDELSDTPSAPAPHLDGPDPPRRRSPWRAAVALIVVIALFLSAGVGIGLWLWDAGGRSGGNADAGGRTSPARNPTAADPSEPPGQLDESSRTATIGDASMQLPDDPYELRSDPVSVPGVLDAAFSAEAEVHHRFDGENNWYAMVALGALSPKVARGLDLAHSGRAALTKLATQMYGEQLVEVTDAQLSDRSVDGYPGVEFSAQIHYAVDRLPSRYDTVRAILVKLDDGTVVAALSSIPDDADQRLTTMAEHSLDSLTIS